MKLASVLILGLLGVGNAAIADISDELECRLSGDAVANQEGVFAEQLTPGVLSSTVGGVQFQAIYLDGKKGPIYLIIQEVDSSEFITASIVAFPTGDLPAFLTAQVKGKAHAIVCQAK